MSRRNRLLHTVARARHLASDLKRRAEDLGTSARKRLLKRRDFLKGLPPVGRPYKPVHEINQELQEIIEKDSYQWNFEQAIKTVSGQKIPELDRIQTLDQYYFYLDKLVEWTPEIRHWQWDGRLLHERTVYLRLTQFYYYFNQPSLEALQSPIDPVKGRELTRISKWMWKFAVAWGDYMNTTPSAEHLSTFRLAPEFNWQDYAKPPEDYKTFNEFFGRTFEDIETQRPVSLPDDDRVIVMPAESAYVGQWEINTAEEPSIVVKHIEWPIKELLANSKYAEDFEGGLLIHSFLNSYDYHRQHAPVGGIVREATVVRGQVYLEVGLKDDGEDASGDLARAVVPQRFLDASDGTGYQFVQCRGLIVIDSPIGKVAVLPMGMAQVSSTVFIDPDDPKQGGIYDGNFKKLKEKIKKTWVGREIKKGEMFSYFQFGGSDIVTVFERKAAVHMTATVGVHYKIRSQIGNSCIDKLVDVKK